MDKRYMKIPVSLQIEIRRQAIADVITHREWSLADSIRHLKKGTRITTAEFARLAGITAHTLQDIERGESDGSVETMNKILGVFGLKLGVVRIPRDDFVELHD